METFGSNLKDLLEHTSWQAELDDTDEAAQLQQENKIRTKVKGLRGLSDQKSLKTQLVFGPSFLSPRLL